MFALLHPIRPTIRTGGSGRKKIGEKGRKREGRGREKEKKRQEKGEGEKTRREVKA
jgi:hypothetical protein